MAELWKDNADWAVQVAANTSDFAESVIKIYGTALSGRTARVLAVLFEKDVTDFELVPIGLDTSPEDLPEFLKSQVCPSTPAAPYGNCQADEKC